jgi:hypothetical protein
MLKKTLIVSLMSLAASCAPVAMAATKLPPAVTQDGMTTQTAKAEQAFPLLKGFLALPAAERDQITLGYVLKVKNAPANAATITLTDQGRTTPINVGAGGRLSPLPSYETLRRGATISITGPKDASVALKLKVYSTQGLKATYDAQGLARGVTQGNRAASKIAGILASIMPKLDRVYFVGATSGTVTFADGRTTALPVTGAAGEYPATTAYFAPSSMAGAKTITLNRAPSAVLFDNPPKK